MKDVDMKNVAIIGGSFNPPTTCHEAIARACLELPTFDEVWLMPSGDRIDKQQSIVACHRLGMLALVQQEIDHEKLIISRFELELPRPSQTIKTLGALAAAHPDIKPTFVFGADSYYNMSNWMDGECLQKQLDMLLVPRAGYCLPHAPNVGFLDIGDIYLKVSSSEVRQRVAAGDSITGLVNKRVEEYIAQENLYGSNTIL